MQLSKGHARRYGGRAGGAETATLVEEGREAESLWCDDVNDTLTFLIVRAAIAPQVLLVCLGTWRRRHSEEDFLRVSQ